MSSGPLTTHVHIHVRTRDYSPFEESKHPRGKGGKFAPKGTSRVKAAVETATKRTALAAKNFSQEDYHILKNNLHAPGSDPRKKTANAIRGLAKSVPQLVKSHLKEEKHKVVGAAAALRSMAKGQRPTPDELKGLRQFSISVVLTGLSFASHGVPAGTVAHLIGALAQEFAAHAALEHGAKAGAGAGRAALSIARTGRPTKVKSRRYNEITRGGGGDAVVDELSRQDHQLLSEYLETLADVVEKKSIPLDRVKQRLLNHKA